MKVNGVPLQSDYLATWVKLSRGKRNRCVIHEGSRLKSKRHMSHQETLVIQISLYPVPLYTGSGKTSVAIVFLIQETLQMMS